MKSEAEIKQTLRAWVIRTNGKISLQVIDDETPIIEQRIITSLQIMDLILFLEKESGRPIEVERLKPGVFRNINVIYRNFFQEGLDGR